MNKIYKLVWSKVRNTWVVASEIAKGHGRSSSSEGNGKLLKSLVLTALLGSFMTAGMSPVAAALTPEQQAVYDAVLAKLEENKTAVHYVSVNSKKGEPNWDNKGATGDNAVAIGRGAKADSLSTVAIGDGASVASNANLPGGVAIGKKAYVLNGIGRQEYYLGFDQSNWNVKRGWTGIKVEGVKDPNRVPTGVAIGANSYARTGSVQIGAHTYQGKMGGADITDKTNREANHINQTTVGTNTFNKGIFGTMLGAYSISTGDFTGEGGVNSMNYGGQNFGSTIAGSLNTIQSKGHGGSAGIANSIVGLANMTENTNGTLIFGAGNKVTNSNKYISGLPDGFSRGAATPDEMSLFRRS